MVVSSSAAAVDSRGDVSDKGETAAGRAHARAPPEEVRSLSGATGEATDPSLPGEVSQSPSSQRARAQAPPPADL